MARHRFPDFITLQILTWPLVSELTFFSHKWKANFYPGRVAMQIAIHDDRV
jgi:hypothetical protein